MSLSSLIVQREIATIRQVEEALARQVLYGGDLVTNLLEVARLDEVVLTALLAESFGMQPVHGQLPMPTERARNLVPGDMASQRAMLPLSADAGDIVVAVAEPLPREVEEELSFALGLRLVQRISPMVRVREGLARAYGAPLERRLQRLLARLGGMPTNAPGALTDMPPLPPSSEGPKRPPSDVPISQVIDVPQSGVTDPPAYATVPAPPQRVTDPGFAAAPPVRPRAVAVPYIAPPSSAPPPPPAPPDIPAPPLVAAVAVPSQPPNEVPQSQVPPQHRESSMSPRGARRRRGPITPDQARLDLDEAESPDAILELFFDYARQYFDYSALFRVQGEIAEGREAYGDGAPRERVQQIGVPLDLPSVLSAARDAKAAVRVVPEREGLDPVLLGDLQRTTQGEVLVVPVVVRKRAIALLYGDSGDDGVDVAGSKEIVGFALVVGQSFEKLILKKKAQGSIGKPTQAPMRPAAGQAPSPAPDGPQGVPARGGARSPLAASVPQVDEHPPSSRSPKTTPFGAHMSDRPPPSTAAAVRRPSNPPIPREEPGESDKAPPTALGTGPRDTVPPAPPSESMAVPAHRPPSARAGEPAMLPSVIVDVDEAFGALVDRVVTMGTDEAAEGELLRQGTHALPAIMSRFPGPTVVDRARVEEGALRVSECGPVLRLIAVQRRIALPFVLPLVGDGDPQRRYWATFLITELAYPDAVEPVVPRLFDVDQGVRRVARLAARAIAEVAPEALMERLVRYYRDPSLSTERRIEMIETLGELRERLAVPLLIEALGDQEEEVAGAARRGLMTVARQDLGRDAKKWQAWWAQNAGRHRIEWLIDALMHEVPALRRAAGDELKALTKEYFGYYDDLPRKDREKAQQRYREWWSTEGRLRHQRR